MLRLRYAPISLLPAMSKISERSIAVRIQRHTEELGILPVEHFGVRQRHSTEHQLPRLVAYAADGLYSINIANIPKAYYPMDRKIMDVFVDTAIAYQRQQPALVITRL